MQLVIAKYSGVGTDARMKFVMVGSSGINAVQYDASSGGDVVGPSIFGHNGAESVGTTAAIPYNDSNTPEPYSSRGPVTLYYQPTPSTTALGAPQVLQKPEFAATDNVKNVFFIEPSGGVYRFAGTSAAAPQAAAIGALLREYDSTLTPAQVISTMRSTARAVREQRHRHRRGRRVPRRRQPLSPRWRRRRAHPPCFPRRTATARSHCTGRPARASRIQ